MKLNKDISVIIVNHNRQDFLDRCLRSCIDQLLFQKSFEIIFVDDGSTDSSFDIAKKYMSNVKIFRFKKNRGISAASNFAIKKSVGKYFIRVDSDDFLNKHALDSLANIIEHNKNLAFVCCDHHRVDEFGFKESLVKLNTKKNTKSWSRHLI